MKDRINEGNGKNMSGLLENVQPAVKKETGHIACWSGAGTILMIVAFAVCHKLFPDAVPFDYKVVLGGVIGAFITYTVIVAINQLGPAKATMFIVSAQLIVSYIISLFGLFGTTKAGLAWTRLFGIAVMIGGIMLFKWDELFGK